MGLEPVENSGNTVTAGILAASAARSNQLAGLRPWQPGTSGNPSGRPKSARFRRECLKQLKMEVVPGITRLACIVDSTIERAGAETAAYTALRDTVDGKPTSNEQHTTVGTINIAWGSMPGWAGTPQPSASIVECNSVLDSNTVDCRESKHPAEVQLKVLESAPRRPAQTRPAKLRDRVPVSTVPVQAASVPATKSMSVTRMVAERALAKLADMDTVGMSPATFKNYLAKVRVAEEALAAL